jgi:hypothetical protein
MAKKRPVAERPMKPLISAEAALTFLKDTKGAVTWSVRYLTDVLKVNRRDAEQVAAFLEAQGYVKRESGDEWITTPAGESVSGSTFPRFTRDNVGQGVESLRERMKQVNRDSNARFRITHAVAFGDFLLKDRSRVQAAEVGIGLTLRGQPASESHSADDAREERKFLRELRGKTALLHIRPYARLDEQEVSRQFAVAIPFGVADRFGTFSPCSPVPSCSLHLHDQ